MFRLTWTSLAGLALALPVFSASAIEVPQASISERRVVPSISDAAPFAGQIEYGFDTVLNMSRARYKASLGSGNALLRIFVPAPAVHTVIAVYRLRGRGPAEYPDSVRLTLISDEYRHVTSEYFPLPQAPPILVASLGDAIVTYPLGIAQNVEDWAAPNMGGLASRSSRADGSTLYLPQLPREIHIQRTATASIPICDFLTLLNTRNVHGTVAGLEFELNDGVISGLRRFAAEMNPGAAANGGINCR